MVNKTTSFKKKGKGKKGNLKKKNGKQVAAPVKKPKAGPKPETECLGCQNCDFEPDRSFNGRITNHKIFTIRIVEM